MGHARAADSALDFLVIGHVTKDLVPSGFVFGGTVSFSALTARNLGRQAGVLTSADCLPELRQHFRGVALHVLPAPETTTFENVYTARGRVQYVRAVAPAIPADAVPTPWRGSRVVHLGPLVQEVPPEIAEAFPPETLVGATPQGWLRTWDAEGRVRPTPWQNVEAALAKIDALVFSIEDMGGDQELARRYAEMARLAVVTEDSRGCTVWEGGRRTRYPAFEAAEVDPTGAGDVFAAAFFLRYGETRDSAEAARYANCVASFSVEGRGTTAIPSAEQVAQRLESGKLLT
ncbi:MAG TPA: PfkB family carbohydrate kinase [Chloroflexota bacterium]|jgi:hypothetical protein|nr:PfkB family carbohydrate kinase [Chloroflexota bacterium]